MSGSNHLPEKQKEKETEKERESQAVHKKAREDGMTKDRQMGFWEFNRRGSSGHWGGGAGGMEGSPSQGGQGQGNFMRRGRAGDSPQERDDARGLGPVRETGRGAMGTPGMEGRNDWALAGTDCKGSGGSEFMGDKNAEGKGVVGGATKEGKGKRGKPQWKAAGHAAVKKVGRMGRGAVGRIRVFFGHCLPSVRGRVPSEAQQQPQQQSAALCVSRQQTPVSRDCSVLPRVLRHADGVEELDRNESEATPSDLQLAEANAATGGKRLHDLCQTLEFLCASLDVISKNGQIVISMDPEGDPCSTTKGLSIRLDRENTMRVQLETDSDRDTCTLFLQTVPLDEQEGSGVVLSSPMCEVLHRLLHMYKQEPSFNLQMWGELCDSVQGTSLLSESIENGARDGENGKGLRLLNKSLMQRVERNFFAVATFPKPVSFIPLRGELDHGKRQVKALQKLESGTAVIRRAFFDTTTTSTREALFGDLCRKLEARLESYRLEATHGETKMILPFCPGGGLRGVLDVKTEGDRIHTVLLETVLSEEHLEGSRVLLSSFACKVLEMLLRVIQAEMDVEWWESLLEVLTDICNHSPHFSVFLNEEKREIKISIKDPKLQRTLNTHDGTFDGDDSQHADLFASIHFPEAPSFACRVEQEREEQEGPDPWEDPTLPIPEEPQSERSLPPPSYARAFCAGAHLPLPSDPATPRQQVTREVLQGGYHPSALEADNCHDGESDDGSFSVFSVPSTFLELLAPSDPDFPPSEGLPRDPSPETATPLRSVTGLPTTGRPILISQDSIATDSVSAVHSENGREKPLQVNSEVRGVSRIVAGEDIDGRPTANSPAMNSSPSSHLFSIHPPFLIGTAPERQPVSENRIPIKRDPLTAGAECIQSDQQGHPPQVLADGVGEHSARVTENTGDEWEDPPEIPNEREPDRMGNVSSRTQSPSKASRTDEHDHPLPFVADGDGGDSVLGARANREQRVGAVFSPAPQFDIGRDPDGTFSATPASPNLLPAAHALAVQPQQSTSADQDKETAEIGKGRGEKKEKNEGRGKVGWRARGRHAAKKVRGVLRRCVPCCGLRAQLAREVEKEARGWRFGLGEPERPHTTLQVSGSTAPSAGRREDADWKFSFVFAWSHSQLPSSPLEGGKEVLKGLEEEENCTAQYSSLKDL
uniref:Uncharacterized protein n=1 Tax=Chromera velia CCMP2878 TaxID=1169474 RepID=A0A0G4I2E2_9ALVE|eukprot:Cvel_10368.t1-p1 / transcript=Cvel_10368.t1 / gene=Cvel_10368 / organism=Chromera_velia_CCMP2878 / gene_product=hypothetical protein / transcript_product=hypothetical protein / location=Cvel_scaffold624:36243-44280(-) / protein_length=1160 / sequence_SO=supercontig / SO=protein_coding / is_pseudo=false